LDVPDPSEVRVRLAGLRVALSPLVTVGEMLADKPTVPANPLTLVRVMLELTVDPAADANVEGFEAILKSRTTFMLEMKVDQHGPAMNTCCEVTTWGQIEVALEWYSPATHTRVGSLGSTPAPK
jgi:hypothetical protein